MNLSRRTFLRSGIATSLVALVAPHAKGVPDTTEVLPASALWPLRERGCIEWAKAQPKGPPSYMVGDVVVCHENGGVGIVCEVNPPQGGWPSSYAVDAIPGKPKPPKHAWYYEGEFKCRLARSPLHGLG